MNTNPKKTIRGSSAKAVRVPKSPPLQKVSWGVLAGAVTLLGLLAQVHADVNVSGTVVNERWTKANSPYKVVGNILVAGLTIEEGVQVLSSGDYVFEVGGVLTVTGTALEPVTFTSLGKGWQGIFFNQSSPGSELRYCVISKSVNSAVRIVNSIPVIKNCSFISNSSPGNGGAISASMPTGDLVLEGCVFTKNQAAVHGGGISAEMKAGTLQMRDCIVSENIANPSVNNGDYVGGGIAVWGKANLSNCEIRGNVAYSACSANFGCNVLGRAGGVYLSGTGTLENCSLTSNIVSASNRGDCFFGGSSLAYGGAVYLEAGNLTIRNSIFARNPLQASNCGPARHGAGLFVNSGVGRVMNATFAYNDADAIWGNSGTAVVLNSIVYFNQGGQMGGKVSVTYSDVQGGYSGLGNTDFNPIFQSTNNLVIVLGSRCIDAGNPDPAYNDTCFPPSLGGERNDMGAHGGPGACEWLVGDAPKIVVDPKSQASCLGQSVTFLVMATGAEPLHYQWLFNGDPMKDQTGTNLTLVNLQGSDAGTYSVVVSNAVDRVTSAPAQLTVYEACIDLQMYAGLNISGKAGATYLLSFTTDLSNTNSWVPLATNLLSNSDWFYLDMDSPFSPKRFYKVNLKP